MQPFSPGELRLPYTMTAGPRSAESYRTEAQTLDQFKATLGRGIVTSAAVLLVKGSRRTSPGSRSELDIPSRREKQHMHSGKAGIDGD